MAQLNPLDRLYQTKLALLAVLLVMAGIVVLAAAKSATAASGWLGLVPWTEIGSGLFTTGLLTVALAYLDRKDADVRAMNRLREVFKEQAPALRDSTLDTFAADPATLAKVASDKTLDGIVQSSLGIQLGDAELAQDVYKDVREQVLRASERWRDVRVDVTLAPWAGGPSSGRGSMFEATIRWEYRVKMARATQRFSCVSDLAEYREMLHDPTSTLVWYFEPIGELNAASSETFELLSFTVDGKAKPARRSKRVGSQTYVVDVEAVRQASEVVVAYTFRVLVQRNSHMLQIDLAKPAKNFMIRFTYEGCGIRHVNVLDFVAANKQPAVLLPKTAQRSVVEVSFEGWTWPKAGAGFVWVLANELTPTSARSH